MKLKLASRVLPLVFVLSILLAPAASRRRSATAATSARAYWGTLDPAWSTCETGTIQSPVDLTHQRTWMALPIDYVLDRRRDLQQRSHRRGRTSFRATATRSRWTGLSTRSCSSTSTRRASTGCWGAVTTWSCTSCTRRRTGQYAVIGVLLQRGASSGALAPIFATLPDIAVREREVPAADLQSAAFLPPTTAHYRYLGSLTTPPCSEGVKWIVLRDPVTVSDEDMAQFADQISFNARYVQRVVPR